MSTLARTRRQVGADTAADVGADTAAEVGADTGANVGSVANLDKPAMAERVRDAAAAGERYKVQFTASQEYVYLLERAQDLLSHAVPDRWLEAIT